MRNQPTDQEETQRSLLSKEKKENIRGQVYVYYFSSFYVVSIDFHVVLSRTTDGLAFWYLSSTFRIIKIKLSYPLVASQSIHAS